MSANGKWRYTLNTEFGVMDGSIDLKQDDAQLSGTFVNLGTSSKIIEGRVEGNQIRFDSTLRTRNAVMMLKVEATFEGDEMSGMFRTPLGDSPFSATRG